jgi:hypothetical protein
MMVEDGNHVARNRFYKYRGQWADWMAWQLDAGAVPAALYTQV